MSFTLDSILKERLKGSEKSDDVCRVDFGLIDAEIEGPAMNDRRFRGKRGGGRGEGRGGGGGEVESALPIRRMTADLHSLKMRRTQKCVFSRM